MPNWHTRPRRPPLAAPAISSPWVALLFGCQAAPVSWTDPDPIAVVGEEGALLTTSRPLEDGERWVSADGAAVQWLDETTAWSSGAGPFSVVSPGAVVSVAQEQAVALEADRRLLLLGAEDADSVTLSWSPVGATLALRWEGTEVGEDSPVTVKVTGGDAPGLTIREATLAPLGWPDAVLATAVIRTVESGLALRWGDLHSHSNLSHDGCEDVETDCLPRYDTPAVGAMEEAEAAGLDFVALTEHAEDGTWEDLVSGVVVDAWTETQRIADEASGGPVLALVGLEWTGGIGHRTVLFDSTSVCDDLHVRARDTSAWDRPDGVQRYEPADGPIATSPVELVAALDEASKACGVAVRSWFHHTAYKMPRMVDWSLPDNVGLGDRVIEIASEHGSSECADETAAGCDFEVDSPFFYGAGSVQTALALGLNLGFVGGTDNHDARPGSTDDGPSGAFTSTGFNVTAAQGATTGLLVPADEPFDAAAVFSALDDRRALAATLRPQTLVAVLMDQGAPVPPGADVLPGDHRLLVRLEAPAVVDFEVDLVNRGAEALTLLPDEQGLLDTTVTIPDDDLLYVRIRMTDNNGDAQRVWLSPWFAVP